MCCFQNLWCLHMLLFSHPQNVCLTYFQHFRFSMNTCRKLFVASIKSFVHAIYPDIFITSTSDLLLKLQNDMKEIGCRNATK